MLPQHPTSSQQRSSPPTLEDLRCLMRACRAHLVLSSRLTAMLEGRAAMGRLTRTAPTLQVAGKPAGSSHTPIASACPPSCAYLLSGTVMRSVRANNFDVVLSPAAEAHGRPDENGPEAADLQRAARRRRDRQRVQAAAPREDNREVDFDALLGEVFRSFETVPVQPFQDCHVCSPECRSAATVIDVMLCRSGGTPDRAIRERSHDSAACRSHAVHSILAAVHCRKVSSHTACGPQSCSADSLDHTPHHLQC